MARIEGVDLPRNKRVEVGLTYIYGIGLPRAQRILQATGVNPDTRIKDLTDAEVTLLRDYIGQSYKVEGDLPLTLAAKSSGFCQISGLAMVCPGSLPCG